MNTKNGEKKVRGEEFKPKKFVMRVRCYLQQSTPLIYDCISEKNKETLKWLTDSWSPAAEIESMYSATSYHKIDSKRPK